MADYTARSSVTLNGKQAEDQLEKLTKKASILREEMKKLRQANDKTGFDKNKKELDEVNKEMRQMRKETLSVESVLKNLSGASFKEIAAAARKATAEFKAMKQTDPGYKEKARQAQILNDKVKELSKLTRAQQTPTQKLIGMAKGLLPAFGFTAIIAGAVKGAKAIYNMYSQTAKARREAEQLTGLSGKQLADFTASVQATADTFDRDYKEVLVSTNNFAQTMGVTVEEALQKINDGFISGSDSSGEFLDILKEYGPQFKAAGLSADESIALISQQVTSGIYSDKGIDTIKEGTLRLREMTTATKTAIDGIGLSSATIEQQLKNGTISIFDAIQMVSNRLAELPPQSAVVGTAIADIFGGPGEDAGLEYIKMLGQAELSLEKVKAGAGENALAQEKLLEANTKLKQAWGELMGTGTGTFTAIKASAVELLAGGVASLSKGIKNVRDWFIELYNGSLPVRAGIQYMISSWVTGFNIVKTALQGLWEQLKLGAKLIKAVLTFDIYGIKTVFQEYSDNLKNAVVTNAQKVADTWKNAYEQTLNGQIKVGGELSIQDSSIFTSGTETTDFENTQPRSGSTQHRQKSMEEMQSIDPRIEVERTVSAATLEESKLRKKILDNEQKAVAIRAAEDIKIQEERKAAYLSTLDTIIGVFGEESRIGRAALLAKQAWAIAETVINIAKGTGETAASVPFPANIPMIIGFVAQVAGLIGTIKGATKGVKGYASGKYIDFIGRPQTGMYGTDPHLALFNEVAGKPEMVIDGVTTNRMMVNYPEIAQAIYAIRDGRNPVMYADGKYNDEGSNLQTGSLTRSLDDESKKLILQNTKAMEAMLKMKIYTSIEDVKIADRNYTEMQNTRGF